MKKLLRIIFIITMILILSGCSKYEYKKISRESLDITNSLIIDKIDMNSEYSISSIDNDVIGIVMFEEYGRPNISDSNVIIGAHSGYGPNARFNRIKELEKNDIIKLYYDNNEYKYEVDDVLEVDDTNVEILDKTDDNTLILLTCKIEDNSKRIIVKAYLI